MCFCTKRDRGEQGQATVEAAVALPMLLVALLLLMQPGILLYDRVVMEGAASEACRLLATATDATGDMTESCETFVRHRLGAVPPVPIFHVHEGGCTWDVELMGDERTNEVTVAVSTEVRPLPLLGAGGALAGILNERGNYVVRVERTASLKPAWAVEGGVAENPAAWPGAWRS